MFVGRRPLTLESMAEIEERNVNCGYLFPEDVCWNSTKNSEVNGRYVGVRFEIIAVV